MINVLLGMGPSVTEPSQLSGANSFYRFDLNLDLNFENRLNITPTDFLAVL